VESVQKQGTSELARHCSEKLFFELLAWVMILESCTGEPVTFLMDPESLISLLESGGWIEKGSADQMLCEYEQSDQDLFEFLESSGVGSKTEILALIAESLGTEYVDLKSSIVPTDLLNAIDPEIARIYQCLPIHVSDDLVKVCLVDPLDDAAVDELSRVFKRPTVRVVADPEDIIRLLAAPPSPEAVLPRDVAVDTSSGDAVRSSSARVGGRRLESFWLLGIVVVSLAAVAMALLYAQQGKSLARAEELLEKSKSLSEESFAYRLKSMSAADEIKTEIARLESILTLREADAIKIEDLEGRLLGVASKLEALEAILSSLPGKQQDVSQAAGPTER